MEPAMQLFTVTIEATTRKTITLAADSIAEASLAAQDIYHHLPADITATRVVEANPIAEAV